MLVLTNDTTNASTGTSRTLPVTRLQTDVSLRELAVEILILGSAFPCSVEVEKLGRRPNFLSRGGPGSKVWVRPKVGNAEGCSCSRFAITQISTPFRGRKTWAAPKLFVLGRTGKQAVRTASSAVGLPLAALSILVKAEKTWAAPKLFAS